MAGAAVDDGEEAAGVVDEDEDEESLLEESLLAADPLLELESVVDALPSEPTLLDPEDRESVR